MVVLWGWVFLMSEVPLQGRCRPRSWHWRSCSIVTASSCDTRRLPPSPPTSPCSGCVAQSALQGYLAHRYPCSFPKRATGIPRSMASSCATRRLPPSPPTSPYYGHVSYERGTLVSYERGTPGFFLRNASADAQPSHLALLRVCFPNATNPEIRMNRSDPHFKHHMVLGIGR